MTAQTNIFGQRYDDAEPCFITNDDGIYVYNRADGRTLEWQKMLQWQYQFGHIWQPREVGIPSVFWQTYHRGGVIWAPGLDDSSTITSQKVVNGEDWTIGVIDAPPDNWTSDGGGFQVFDTDIPTGIFTWTADTVLDTNTLTQTLLGLVAGRIYVVELAVGYLTTDNEVFFSIDNGRKRLINSPSSDLEIQAATFVASGTSADIVLYQNGGAKLILDYARVYEEAELTGNGGGLPATPLVPPTGTLPKYWWNFDEMSFLPEGTTFSRGSPASYFDVHGDLVFASDEQARFSNLPYESQPRVYNNFLWSFDLTQPVWEQFQAHYDQLDEFAREGSGDGEHYCQQAAYSDTPNGMFYVELKPSGDDRSIKFSFGEDGIVDAFYVDLSIMVPHDMGANVTSVSVTEVTDGWYQVIAILENNTFDSDNTFRWQFCQAAGSTVIDYLGDGFAGVGLRKPMFDPDATEFYTYVQTSQYQDSVPPTILGIPIGILIEDTSTNVLTYSTDMSDAAWVGTAASIDYTDVLKEDDTLADHYLEQAEPGSSANGAIQIEIKDAGFDRALAVSTSASADNQVIVNPKTGETNYTGANVTDLRALYLGDGWYRLSYVVAGSADTLAVQLRLVQGRATAIVADYLGDNESGVLMRRPQFEVDGLAPTSYIETIGTAMTRNADILDISMAIEPPWSIGLTLFWETYDAKSDVAQDRVLGTLQNATPTQYMRSLQDSVAGGALTDWDDGTNGLGSSEGYTPMPQTRQRLATAVDGAGGVTAGDGVLGTPSVAPFVGSLMDVIQIGRDTAGTFLNGHVRKLQVFEAKLIDSDLTSITEPPVQTLIEEYLDKPKGNQT